MWLDLFNEVKETKMYVPKSKADSVYDISVVHLCTSGHLTYVLEKLKESVTLFMLWCLCVLECPYMRKCAVKDPNDYSR